MRTFGIGFCVLVGVVGCGGSDGGSPTPPATCVEDRVSLSLVVNSLQLPGSIFQFAADIDGDGQTDNALGRAVGALVSTGADAQGPVTALVASGEAPLLVTAASSDASFTSDVCPTLTLLRGLPATAPPSYAGADTFQLDASRTALTLDGQLDAHVFSTVVAGARRFAIPVSFGNGTVEIPIVATQVQATLDASGTVTDGTIAGAVLAADIESSLVIPVAQGALQRSLDPTAAPGLLILFDDGGTAAATCGMTCADPIDGTCATASDGVLQLCEVTTSPLILQLLAPDIHLLGSDGSIAPDPANPVNDAFSVGVGFTAVRATF